MAEPEGLPLEDLPPDLTWLAERYPEWQLGVAHVTVASGPDHRQVYAVRGEVTLTADSAGALTALLANTERG